MSVQRFDSPKNTNQIPSGMNELMRRLMDGWKVSHVYFVRIRQGSSFIPLVKIVRYNAAENVTMYSWVSVA